MERMTLAEGAADGVLRLLLDRGGFDGWWDEIDRGTREDIAREIGSSIVAALVEAGWGPTAAHEACIERLREWRPTQTSDGVWWWKKVRGKREKPEPMTEAERLVMSRGVDPDVG